MLFRSLLCSVRHSCFLWHLSMDDRNEVPTARRGGEDTVGSQYTADLGRCATIVTELVYSKGQ